jgi:hypothetical protein
VPRRPSCRRDLVGGPRTHATRRDTIVVGMALCAGRGARLGFEVVEGGHPAAVPIVARTVHGKHRVPELLPEPPRRPVEVHDHAGGDGRRPAALAVIPFPAIEVGIDRDAGSAGSTRALAPVFDI